MAKKLLIFLLAMLTVSCSPKIIRELQIETVKEYVDSLVYRDTTIYVPLPVESSTNILPIGSISHLETSLAESDAWVDSLGLHHSINNKERDFGVKVPYPTRTIVAKAETQQIQTLTRTVEKPLTFWQQLKMRGFWVLLLSWVLFFLIKFRRPILAFIKGLL